MDDSRQRRLMIYHQLQPEKRPASVIPYAIFVPVLVVMAQSAWVVQHGSEFRHTLLAGVFSPVAFGGMAVSAVISFFVIRPFARRVISRWIALLACVLAFTMLIESLLPH